MTLDPKPSFISYLHSFRGFAIINIVAIHAFGFAGSIASKSFSNENAVDIANNLLFHNSTIYFAIISGMLFTAVLKRKGYQAFFRSKFKYIFLPYVFFTLVFSLFDTHSNELFALQPNLQTYLMELLRNLLYGKAIFVFWYMPVLFFLYLVTPILDYLMNIKKWGPWIIMLIIAIPVVVRRVEVEDLMKSDFLSLQTMIYFTGAYAAGMFIADNLEKRLNWIRQNKWIFIGTAVVSTLGLLYIILHSIDRFAFFSLSSTLYYIQKIALSGIVLVFFKSLEDTQPKWLNPVAKSAFTIFFAHVFFLGVAIAPLISLLRYQKIAPFNILAGGVLLVIISIILSMILVWIFHKISGKYSRMIIGS